jgi:hypothetical protein
MIFHHLGNEMFTVKKKEKRYTHLSMVPNQFQYSAETKFLQTQHTTVLLLTHGFLPVSMEILRISTQLMSTQASPSGTKMPRLKKCYPFKHKEIGQILNGYWL